MSHATYTAKLTSATDTEIAITVYVNGTHLGAATMRHTDAACDRHSLQGDAAVEAHLDALTAHDEARQWAAEDIAYAAGQALRARRGENHEVAVIA